MIRRLAIAAIVAMAVAVSTVRAATVVTYQDIASGPNLEEAVAFLSTYLEPDDYDTAKWFKDTGYASSPLKLGNTLDLYVRGFVRFGKADINGDGVPERFYLFDDSRRCGSAGCELLIVESSGNGGRLLCSVSGGETGLVVTDRVTIHGYHELEIPEIVYWYDGDRCDTDTPGVDGYGTRRRDPLR